MTTTYAPSDKQVNFLRKLAGERVATSLGDNAAERVAAVNDWLVNEEPDYYEVSRRISWFTQQPKDLATLAREGNSPVDVARLTPGVYENEDGVFVVKPNQAKTRLYAKRLVEIGGDRLVETGDVVQIEFEYAPGAIFKLRPEHRMAFEKARELTIRYARCIACGRHLKNAKSVELGIGPVCRKYFS